ncbi:MAG: ABC transporter permease [Bacteroidetes bacterium]|jgi:Cu-processing system permease protein|nr:ABC transporter permease [Bacteroidota bacterium]
MLFYTLFLLVTTFSVFSLDENPAKGLLSMLNIILLIVPLVSIMFSTIYLYNSAEFIELLVSQPLKRKTIWLSLFIGLSASFSFSLLIGIGLPIIIFQPNAIGAMLIGIGIILSNVFIAIAMLSSVKTRDKAKGIGFAILVWLYFTILFDGLVLFFLFQFADYPLDKIMIIISSFNPIDLSRILILLQLDVSAMMGYTGAIFKDFFGTSSGMIISFSILMFWVFFPVFFSIRNFNKKDL